MSNENPLLKPFEFSPFSKIKTEDFKPAFKKSLQQAEREIDKITSNANKPTFENTIEALDYSGEQLGRVSAILFNLNSAETNTDIQKITQDVSPWLSKFNNDLMLNQALFQRVKAIYEQREKLNLNEEQKTLLDKHYKAFTRNGANLSETNKKRLREIDEQLSKLSLTFGENVLAATNDFELHITDKTKLAGLPESHLQVARELAESKDKKGYLFTLHYPSYLPFMKYVDSRDLRKKMAVANGQKAFGDSKYNNEENVLQIVRLRYERAQLLGFKNHADYVLKERMAKTPKTVENFLNDLLEKARPAAQAQFNELEEFAQNLDHIERLQPWDKAYYAEKLKQKKFELHEEDLKSYFQLENVIDGAFEVAHKLYGIYFKKTEAVDKYHEEVRTYKVYDENDNYLALFYADFHPRPGKRGGAWMTVYKDQQIKNGKNERPQASIVCNFSRASKNKPALLTFQEVTTLFHEFGHALHAMLANTTYPGLSGTSVFWDFVELPSQLMENWCYEEETLALFAKHYETGKIISMNLIEKIKKSANFMEGMQTLRQLSFGMLDMSWHNTDPRDISNVKAHEVMAFRSTQLFPDMPENCMSTSFGHIFQGGYSAGYYSYKWAEVLDADAFAYFKENGIFDSTTAMKFKDNVLTKGGTEDPMKLYKRFRGKKPDNRALLKRAGLI